MLIFDYLFYLIREYRVLTCLGLAVSGLLLLMAYSKAAGRPRLRRGLRAALQLLPLLILTIFVFGRPLSRAYVLRRGRPGTGAALSSRPTFVTVNKRRVLEYRTLLKLADGRLYETSFDEQSANVYGAGEAWYHLPPMPLIGQRFSVYYLPGLPHNFIILANDSRSEFGQQVQCQPLRLRYAEALQAYQFDNASPALQAALLTSLDALIGSACLPTQEKQLYRSMKQQVEQGRR
jgi:hypothetical protein